MALMTSFLIDFTYVFLSESHVHSDSLNVIPFFLSIIYECYTFFIYIT